MAKENIDMHNLYDLDMERAILASIIYSADNLSEIFDIISPFDFYLRDGKVPKRKFARRNGVFKNQAGE